MHQETFIDGVWYPSATTVLSLKEKPWLTAWFDKWGSLATRKTEASKAIGSEFHRGVEMELGQCAGDPVTSRRVLAMLSRFNQWAHHVNGTIDHVELRVVSRKHRYSGTLDAVGTLDGEPTLFDWKTSSGIYEDMGLQLSAYANAYEEMTGVGIKRGLIVLVSKDKPDHKLTVKEFKLGKKLLGQFLKRLEEFRAAIVEPGGSC